MGTWGRARREAATKNNRSAAAATFPIFLMAGHCIRDLNCLGRSMHKPFAVLEDLVRDGRIKFVDGTVNGEQRDFAIPALPKGMRDEELFEHAMKDVKALGWSAVPLHNRPPLEIQ